MQELLNRFVLIFSLSLLSCSGLQVSQDYDRNTDFSNLRSFAWKTESQAKTGEVRVDNPLLDRRIRAAVNRNLTAAGFVEIPNGTPDFVVSYAFQIRTRIGSDGVRTSIGFGSGGGGSFGGVGVSSSGGVNQYEEGTLVIDLTSVEGGDLLWRGSGTRRLPRASNPEQITATVDQSVDRILAQFPPQSK